MAGSYRFINYSLRPAKTVERKMLSDIFRRLSAFDKIENYSYIGFGSTYFSDFSLFHRDLSISNMLSIEKDKNNAERFEFNKPYSCIKLKFESSTAVLPNIKWDDKKIVWLDYDDTFNSEMLLDLNTFISEASAGSMLVISYNASLDNLPPNTVITDPTERNQAIFEHRLLKLKERFDESKIPLDINGSQLNLKGILKVYFQIFIDEIQSAVKQRNYRNSKGNKLEFIPLINFVYSDGAQMQTLGGILIDTNQREQFDKARFYDLPFVNGNSNSFAIEVPNLTYKEIRHLNSVLHYECDLNSGDMKNPSELENGGTLKESGIPPSDIKKYLKIYRYFPTFAESFI